MHGVFHRQANDELVRPVLKSFLMEKNHDKTLMGSQILPDFDFSANCNKIFICIESSQSFQQFHGEF
jgi:hypothetical protein